MRYRTPVMIALALGGGMLASMVVANLAGDRTPEVAKEESTRIYVALRDLRDGEALDERNVMLAHWPTRGLPPGAIGQIGQLKSQRVNGHIAAGQPIQDTQFKPVVVQSSVPADSPATRSFAVEIGAASQGPWVVSTGERLNITPLEEVWRQAIEVAKRTNPDPIEPLSSSTRTVDEAPQGSVAASQPNQQSPAAPAFVANVAPLYIEQIPWMSSIVTPEGAKVLHWRNPGSTSPASRGQAEFSAPTTVNTISHSASDTRLASLAPGQRCEVVGHTLAGRPFDWSAYRGRPVLLVVYLARSSACRDEIALVERLADAYRHRGLEVVGVGLDEDLNVVRSFARHNQLSWPNVVGPTAREWARTARLESALSLIVVSDEGRVAGIGARAHDVATAVAAVCAEVQEPLPPVREARRADAVSSQP